MANAYTNNEVWQVCLNRIKEQTPQNEFAKWFEPIHPISFDGTNLRLMVPNASYVTHIQENYMKIFAQAIMQMYGRQTRLLYSVPSSEDKTTVSENADMTSISRHVAQTDTSNIMKS